MPASLDHIYPSTPMGANLIADGATFRVWAPNAHAVYAIGDFNIGRATTPACSRATSTATGGASSPASGTASATCSTSSGTGSEGPKRDPYARELATPFPSDCIVRKTDLSLARDRLSSRRRFMTS